MPLPKDVNTINSLLSNLSAKVQTRHHLTQTLISALKGFNGNPVSVDIPPTFKITDIEAVIPVFEQFGFRCELRFVSGSSPYIRFYEGD